MFKALMNTIKAKGMLPKVSDTERAALEAGTVWVDGEFFSGNPDIERLRQAPYPTLTEDERALVQGPAEEVCRRVDAWQLDVTRELPEDVLAYLREQGFYSFNVPEEYGGKPMGAFAKSVIMGKLGPATGAVSTIVTIPNSLGPAELLAHYGTQAQKDKYLRRLAKGELTPCFGLTEPTAGSDAASIKSEGEVFKDTDGELKIKLNFRKRYITLAPIADIVSLAVQLHDPDNLLGKGERPGITCILLEKGTPGFDSGKHHEPIAPFPNGPLVGKDVIVPVDNIIGGPDYAGKGWRMLMETLSGGRAISLPAGAVGAAKHAAASVGPYSAIREQFGISIGMMEGVQAKVAKLAALSYALEAMRTYGCGAIDSGESPPVISAIMKYRATDLARELVTDGMDVISGAGVVRGPNNFLAGSYINSPVGITVEGANILTRTLIVFGQGAVRCHPYALKVMAAVEEDDADAFRQSLLGWAGHFLATFGRTATRGLTRGLTGAPSAKGPTATHYRRLAWTSSRFALLTDLAMFGIGAKLKAAGNLNGRFADILSWMFLATATLRRFEAEGEREEDLILVRWSLDYMLGEIQRHFEEIYNNFPVPVLGGLMRWPGRLWLRINPIGTGVRDKLNAPAARTIQQPGEQYDRLMEHVYLPGATEPGLGRLLHAWRLVSACTPLIVKIHKAQKEGRIPRGRPQEHLEQAVEARIVTEAEAEQIRNAEAARLEAYEVDEFTPQEYTRRMNTRRNGRTNSRKAATKKQAAESE
ncbi:acyl-CoA dehydrogenase [Alkalilimnicola ehrlichii]|nr:acyl-CoA dehydrogenase [Alkalilimnicola ehrlichii]